MLSIPLPFIAGLVVALVMYRNLKGVETPGSRRYLLAFLCFYALQGMIIGLRFGYGVDALMFLQPVTASVMPPLAYLTFRALSSTPVEKPWAQATAPVIMALSMGFAKWLIDPLLLTIFLAYGVAIWRVTRNGDITEAALQQTSATVRAARVTAILLFFFALTDALLAVFTFFYGNAAVPMAVTAMNIGAILIVLVYYFWPDRDLAPPADASERMIEATEDDAAALARIAEALDAGGLYRQENLSLARLARKAGLPPREVSAVINRATGLNVSQYVNNRRIAEACRLLRETDRSVTAIMLEAGFSTKSNFNREFRRVVNASPAQWRAAEKKAFATVTSGKPSA